MNSSPLLAEEIQEAGIDSFAITGFEFTDSLMITRANCLYLSDTDAYTIKDGAIVLENNIKYPVCKRNHKTFLNWHNVEMELIKK